MKDVVIVSGVRLPVGSYGGSLKSISAIDMGAMVVKEAGRPKIYRQSRQGALRCSGISGRIP